MAPLGFLSPLPLPTPTFVQKRALPHVCARRATAVFAPRMGMSVKTAPLPKSQVSLEISVGAEECTAAWDYVLKELTKKAKVDGFRPGKVPKQIVIGQYGKESVLASACEEVIEKSIKKALKDANISAIGQAEVADEGGVDTIIKQYDPNSPLSFTVKIDVWPEASFSEPYENLEIEAEEAKLEDALIDKALEELRIKESFSVLSPEGSTAEMGKLVAADLIGYYRNDDGSKGKKLPEIADGQAVEVNMVEGKYMPGFVEGLLGAKVGEIRDVNVQFPQANPRPELAGLNAVFEVTVNAIKDVVLPELDDEFAQNVSEEKNLEGLRDVIRQRLGTEAESEQEKNINSSIDAKLASIVQVDLPETLVENQIKNKFAKMLTSFKDKGMSDEQVKAMVSKENYELYKNQTRGKVEKTLMVNFAISKIATEKGIKIEPQEVESQMTLVRAELKGEEMEDEAKIRDTIEAQLEREYVLNLLKETARITLVPKEEKEEAKTSS